MSFALPLSESQAIESGETSGRRNVAGLTSTSAAGFATNVICARFSEDSEHATCPGQQSKMPP